MMKVDDNEQVIDRYRKKQNEKKKLKILKSKRMNEIDDEEKNSFDENVENS